MYQSVYVADQPVDQATATPEVAICWDMASDDTSLGAAASYLAVAQQAAAAGVTDMPLTAVYSRSTASGLPGLMKSLAAETSMPVTLQQTAVTTTASAAHVIMQVPVARKAQPQVTEVDIRSVIDPGIGSTIHCC